MNQEEFNRHLIERETSGPQAQVLSKLLHYVKISTDHMGRYHNNFEKQENIYRAYRLYDKEDAKALSKKEPAKLILPISYALTQTALSFLMLTYFNDERLFKLKGTGPEDQRIKEAYELDLAYQTSRQQTYLKFYNWFQDSFKYGFGVLEDTWHEEYSYLRTQQPQTTSPGLIGTMLGKSPVETMVETITKVKTSEGTKLTNISPYCFYPDPSVPMAEFQKGQFVATEDETTISELRAAEGTAFFGTPHIKQTLPFDIYKQRNHRVGQTSMFKDPMVIGQEMKLGGAALKTRIQFKTTQEELKKEYDYDLAPEYPKDQPITMVAVIANDQKLIKFEPLGYLHNKFTPNIIEYSPDHNSYSNPGLGDVVNELQELSTWMLNSHKANVGKNIKNRLIVNPKFVEIADIENGKDVIRLKNNIEGRDIRELIYSLELNDVTRNHVNDIGVINTFIQIVTGINENTLGQYSAGRRSASQTQSVQSASAARLKIHGKLIYAMGVEPLAQKIIANTNQLRSKEFWSYILGEDIEKYPYESTILADPAKICNGFDFVPYEGTMPDEKQREAFLFQEILTSMFSNPGEVQALTGLSIGKTFEHYLRLHNIKNIEDFKDVDLQQQLQTQIVPDEEVVNNPNMVAA